jgi:hypothetical protein
LRISAAECTNLVWTDLAFKHRMQNCLSTHF